WVGQLPRPQRGALGLPKTRVAPRLGLPQDQGRPKTRVARRLGVHEDDAARERLRRAVPPVGDRWLREVEEPARVLWGEVDAAVALGSAERVVPVGAVEGVAALEVLHVGDVAELELLSHG